VVKGVEAARHAASQILGMRLVTHQTGPEGRVVKRLLIEEGVSIAREFVTRASWSIAGAAAVVVIGLGGRRDGNRKRWPRARLRPSSRNM